ncbi:HD domain-containing protein [candidate division KSB1 bacterium]|nr:HD domain-containing protein [candidate division KSB1 bacterium]
MSQQELRDKVKLLVSSLARAVQMNRIYEDKHTLTKEALDQLFMQLLQVLSEKVELTIGIMGDEVIFEGGPVFTAQKRHEGFIEYLKSLGIKKINFKSGIEKMELFSFIQFISKKPDINETPEDLQKRFRAAGIQHVAIGQIGGKVQTKRPELKNLNLEKLVKHDYKESVDFLTKTYKDLKNKESMNLTSARQIVDGLLNNIVKNNNLLPMLTSIKTHDEGMFEHGVNVTVFTMLQAEMLGLDDRLLVDVGMASLLHDIGRLSESDDQSALTELPTSGSNSTEDKEKIQLDKDLKGAKILLQTEGIPVLAAITAFEHNMRFDLKGPPRKIYGKHLNLVSMMIAISDYYDILRKKPEYYEEGGPEKAYDEMLAMSGTHFQPDLLQNFFSVIGVFPPGTLVELDTGETALIIQGNIMDMKRPQIEILYNKDGEKYEEPKIVNLIEKDKRGKFSRTIVKSISVKKQLNESLPPE